MAPPRKYPTSCVSGRLGWRSSRAVTRRRDRGAQADRRAAGINPETLRNWVNQAEIDGGHRPGTSTDDAARIAELERENRELRRANEILKTASAFSRRSSTAN